MGYHKTEIPKGVFGELSKITEEYLELQDAVKQDVKILIGVELSDLLGAVEGFALKNGFTLEDLIKMKELTNSAFADGTRISKPPNNTLEHLPTEEQWTSYQERISEQKTT